MARTFVLSTFLLGAGCGQDVLVGTLQLRSLSDDAGVSVDDVVDAGVGASPEAASAAERARYKQRCKEQRDSNHCDEKGQGH